MMDGVNGCCCVIYESNERLWRGGAGRVAKPRCDQSTPDLG